jgi:tetratricopeptide (TPR) repeat protein
VYAEIAPSRCRTLHLRAAQALALREPDNARSRAFHFDEAGREDEAATAYCQAGEQDLARYAFQDAQAALARALALMPSVPTPTRLRAALALAETCESTGDRTQQQAALREALAGARHLKDDALLLQTLLVSGYALEQMGEYDQAQSQLTEALALAHALGDGGRETYAVFLLGDVCIQRGKWPEAQVYFQQSLALARASGDALLEGKSLRGLALAARNMGAPQESVKWFEQAIAVQRKANDRYSELTTQANLLTAYYDLGAWDQLIALAAELLPVSESHGQYARLSVVQHMQGLAAYALGDYGAARRLLSQSEATYAAGGQRRMAGLLRNTLGLVAEDEGDDTEALCCYRTALANAESLQAATETAYAQHDLGALLVKLEQPQEAMPLLEAARAAWVAQHNPLLQAKSEAFLGLAVLMAGEQAQATALAEANWELFKQGVPSGEQPQGWLWAFYRLLIELGGGQNAERAPAVLRAAYAELQRQAQAIGDAALRRSFFERVPLNRAIVNAHDRVTQASRVVAVSLARRGVPLGRALRPDEFVTVRWTLAAPDDEAIADKATRRQHRLARLLREAEAQGAAPTDDVLAEALGVSRRTILRDMQEMARGQVMSTRKRKRS